MNRVEYMTRLASMLQDIPVEERQEAMKYYNDYFDEAGEENEEKVAAELDSPEKVAAAIKAEIYGRNNTGETKAPVYPAEKEEKDCSFLLYAYLLFPLLSSAALLRIWQIGEPVAVRMCWIQVWRAP